MDSIELHVEPRENIGKGASRRLRRAGKAPAVLYGPKRQPLPVTVDAKDITARVGTGRRSLLVRLQSQSAELRDRLALVKEMQFHPVSGKVLHADLYEVDLKSKLRVRVPLEFVGKSVGAELGGILQPLVRDVEVLCLPTDIPDVIRVDVSALGIHGAIHMSEIRPPAGVEVQFETDEPIVTVLAPTVEEVKVEGAAEAEEAPATTGASSAAETKAEGKQ